MSTVIPEAAVALMDGAERSTVYVHVANGMHFSHGRLTLRDLSPSTIVVTADASTLVGHLSTAAFLDRWYRESPGESIQPRPARLSLLDTDQPLRESPQLLVRFPRIREAGLDYDAEVLDHPPPRVSGACVLIIGPTAETQIGPPGSTP